MSVQEGLDDDSIMQVISCLEHGRVLAVILPPPHPQHDRKHQAMSLEAYGLMLAVMQTPKPLSLDWDDSKHQAMSYLGIYVVLAFF